MFTNTIYHIYFIFIYIHSTRQIRNNDLVVTSSGLKEASPNSVGLQFYSVLNNTSDEDYFVELLTDYCCIDSGDNLDCESLEIIGECSEIVRKGNTKTFTLVAPVLDPFQRKGYCVIHLDSRPIDKRNKIMRDVIKIDFDTAARLKNNYNNFEELKKRCKNVDEDPLNDCKPVNCDAHYNGKKPLFDGVNKKCTEAPACANNESDPKIYDPVSNQCVEADAIGIGDINDIKERINKRELFNKSRVAKDVIIVEAKDPAHSGTKLNSTFFNNDLYNTTKAEKSEGELLYLHIIQYLASNKYVLLVLAIVICVQCCFICSMFYRMTTKSVGSCDKTIERKYFNYRQDASVTTPLIATSNINTETTEFDFVSESNVDNRIKCYKACQKKRENDAKISLSDDILAKCLNRRDWNAKPKSETQEPNMFDIPVKNEWSKKISNNFEQQNDVPEHEVVNTAQTEEVDDTKSNSKPDFDENVSSEKLIQCHDYHVMESRKDFCEGRSEEKLPSISTEKGAQACFSNDSVDDFLSEGRMVFLAGEDLSKYSFATNSTTNSELDRSSKTSKKNMIKNVFSYLVRKSKIFTSSDPGVSKRSDKSLEVIHMSKATVYSSSASEYKNLKEIKLPKESRSSIF